MQKEPVEAIEEISEVFKFELWLRFYFIVEEQGKLLISLDDQVLARMEQEFGHLASVASSLNKIELNPSVCQKKIVEHLMDEFEGKKYEIGSIPKILDSIAFKTEIQLFNTWAHLHEDHLDKTTLGFKKWIELYNEWKKSESAEKISLSFSMRDVGQDSGTRSKMTN